MCGITGFYSKTSSIFDNVILKMNSAIAHRGPDGNNSWQDKNSGIVFGHQRLAILDLSTAGDQPMISNSGRYVITFNGEIYNFLELAKKINEVNIDNFKSDTKVLVEYLSKYGLKKTLID